METRADRVPLPAPAGTLVEFLAVRLILERLALARLAREKLDYDGSLAGLMDAVHAKTARRPAASVEQRDACLSTGPGSRLVSAGFTPPDQAGLAALVGEIERFSGIERRWVFHQAFERRLRMRILDAISVHARRPSERVASPRFRDLHVSRRAPESFRRYVEELAPDAETFGAAVFSESPCITAAPPTRITPHCVRSWSSRSTGWWKTSPTRSKIGSPPGKNAANAGHGYAPGPRRQPRTASGALLTAGLGVLASVPLLAHVLFPRLTARIRKTFGRFVQPPPRTRLRLERSTSLAGPEEDQVGYTVEEMANLGERWWQIGLTCGFARVVIILGHGASCLNNPHKSVYDCGACRATPAGQRPGAGPMLNDMRVREVLAAGARNSPRDFVRRRHAQHDRRLNLLLRSRQPAEAASQRFRSGAARAGKGLPANAQERCRRFDSAPLDLDFEEVHEHVEGRSEDLAQALPELGNASNAVCVVGRPNGRGACISTAALPGLVDPTKDDDERTILARILSRGPVCEGINMQYSLSYIDNAGWACGTKLPHNVTSLLGVMDGAERLAPRFALAERGNSRAGAVAVRRRNEA